jgi:cystathionine gamma-synthase
MRKTFFTNELGQPMPDSEHAISVCMPQWQNVIDYEQGKPELHNALKNGYPRFVLHDFIKQVIHFGQKHFSCPFCLPWPSRQVAQRAAAFIQKELPIDEYNHLFFLQMQDENDYRLACEYWQHTGEIISSRQAQDFLSQQFVPTDHLDLDQIKNKIAAYTPEAPENVYLFPSGMAAIFQAYRLLESTETIQLGFPYVDTVKIQQKFGKVHFVPDVHDLQKVHQIVSNHQIGAIFTEFPTNPLLRVADLKQLSLIARDYQVPLFIDDTLGCNLNVGLMPEADLLLTSLSKFFSGQGDVLAGSLVLNSRSPFYQRFKTALSQNYQNLLYGRDAKVLAVNSQDLLERVTQINFNAEQLADFLQNHQQIKRVHYPKYQDQNYYLARSKGLGFGGIFSLEFYQTKQAEQFYNKLKACKGPSLGTNYTLACPYTLLAHYHELDFAAECGVSQHLIRVSVGLEPIKELMQTFGEAFTT